MKFDRSKFLLILLVFCLLGCDVFTPEEPSTYVTYKTTVAGNGYDVALGAIETNDAYVLAGALGPQCDIVDAFMAKVDKENGAIFNLKTFGSTNQGFEENFFAINQIQGSFKAVGFALKPQPPTEPTSLFCSRADGDFDAKLFFGSLDENFNETSSQYLEMDSTKWDSGFDIVENTDGTILVAGAWSARVAVIQLQADVLSKVIRSDNYFGDAKKVFFHSSGRIFVIGSFIEALTGFSKKNIYWAELDIPNSRLLNEKAIYHEDRNAWPEVVFASIAETPDGNLLLGGLLRNETSGRKIFIRKTDLEGGELFFKTLDVGIDDALTDLISVDDGYVVAGSTEQTDGPGNDALIAKIDENGNIIWQESHDLRGNDEWTETIIQTNDGGFLLAGQTSSEENGIRTILLIKTDAEGKVE